MALFAKLAASECVKCRHLLVELLISLCNTLLEPHKYCLTLNAVTDILPPQSGAASDGKKQRLVSDVFSVQPSRSASSSDRDKKWVLARQLALMCCTDLCPFDTVEKPGFVMFMKQNRVIKSADDLPSAVTLSHAALNTVYDETREKIKHLLVKAPKTVGMTTDLWTDNYKKRSYATFTLHFSTNDFCMHDVTLRTVVFPEAHTGENIKAAMDETVEMFDLQDKKIVYVTDQGSNIVKACRLAGVERHGCVAHGLHNLVMVDGLRKCEEAQKVIDKVKDIVKTFTFKTATLEKEANAMANEAAATRLLSEVTEEISGETTSSSDCDEENDDERGGSVTVPHVRTVPFLKTLKKYCQTRWNTILTMLDSLIENQTLVERCLSQLRLFDKLCSNDEWETIVGLSKFLKVFKTTSEIMSGEKYPTISLVLLFRTEVEHALIAEPGDCTVVKQLKESMHAALDHRLPVIELHAVAAMLDPSQRQLSAVQEFLAARNLSAVQLLTDYLDRYVTVTVNDELGQAEQNSGGVRDEPSSTGPPPWKRAKLELLTKHGSSQSNPSREIQQYRCLSVSDVDPLQWWKTQNQTYRRLSQLARAILAIPATSAPSERIFSTAGVVINAKRSSLSPHVVDKVIFVHENGHVLDGNGMRQGDSS